HRLVGIVVPAPIPQVGVAGDQTEHALAAGADQDGRPAWARSTWNELAVVDLVVTAGVVDLSGLQEGMDNRERLFKAAYAMIEWVAERPILRLVPPGAQAKDQPSVTDLVDRVGHLRQQRG